jgi:4-oxalomesaconate tautomerase
VATALTLPDTPGHQVAKLPAGAKKLVSVEHPSGEFSVELELSGPPDDPVVERAALLRTARRLFEGSVFVPRSVWDGGA